MHYLYPPLPYPQPIRSCLPSHTMYTHYLLYYLCIFLLTQIVFANTFFLYSKSFSGDPVMHGSEMTMRNGCGSSHSDYSQVEDATLQLMKGSMI